MTAPTVNHGIDRAFLTAHLLTASIEQAEGAISQAIGVWNPDEESEEILFQNVLDAAARAPVELSQMSSSNPNASSFRPS